MKVVVAVPHSHTWFWTQTCLTTLIRNPPAAEGCECEVVVVDNSPWSPAAKGVYTLLLRSAPPVPFTVAANAKSNKFHASALDFVVERFDFDYLVALETDVLLLRPGWLRWFFDQLRESDYAVGAWHHERFVNPSCTLYRGSVLRDMLKWCEESAPQDELRWGPAFQFAAPIDDQLPAKIPGDSTTLQYMEGLSREQKDVLTSFKGWIAGPFAEKRGWSAGCVLAEPPSGQLKGPGWYEPGQQLHSWAVQRGWTYTVAPTLTTHVGGCPVQTLYGASMPDPLRQLEAEELFGNAEAAHMWGGTRALDVLKHPVTCQFVKANTPGWLAREARFWRSVVPPDVRAATLDQIRKHGWHTTGQGKSCVDDRDREAAEFVRRCYAEGGVSW